MSNDFIANLKVLLSKSYATNHFYSARDFFSCDKSNGFLGNATPNDAADYIRSIASDSYTADSSCEILITPIGRFTFHKYSSGDVYAIVKHKRS